MTTSVDSVILIYFTKLLVSRSNSLSTSGNPVDGFNQVNVMSLPTCRAGGTTTLYFLPFRSCYAGLPIHGSILTGMYLSL
jgi:hypothetical protein